MATNQTLVVTLSSFGINPSSTATSSPLTVFLYSSDQFLVLYSNTTETLSFTAGPFLLLLLTANDTTNSATTQYNLFLQQSKSWEANSTVIFTFPSTITLGSTPVCTDQTSAVLTCSVGSSGGQQTLTVSLPGTTNSLNLNLSPVTNPPSLAPTAPFSITTQNSQGHLYATDSSTLTLTNTVASSFPSVAHAWSQQLHNASTDLTITVSHRTSSNQYTLANAAQLSSTNVTCSTPSVPVDCSFSGNDLVITPTNSSQTFALNGTVTISNLFVPLGNVSTMTLSSSSNGFLVSSYAGVTFETICTLPCYTCNASTPTVCLSCYPTTTFTNSIYFYNNQCYETCPNTLYPNTATLTCDPCDANCLWCNNSPTNCTECHSSANESILNTTANTCVATCADGYYPESTTSLTTATPVCALCVDPCATCTSSTTCLSCANSSLFLHLGSCITTCPLLTSVPNVTSNLCDPCDNICATC